MNGIVLTCLDKTIRCILQKSVVYTIESMTKTKRKKKKGEDHVIEQNKKLWNWNTYGKIEIERRLSSRVSCGLRGINSIPTHFRNFGMWLKIQLPRFGAFQTCIMCLDLYGLHYYTMVTMHLKSTKKQREILKMKLMFVLKFY